MTRASALPGCVELALRGTWETPCELTMHGFIVASVRLVSGATMRCGGHIDSGGNLSIFCSRP